MRLGYIGLAHSDSLAAAAAAVVADFVYLLVDNRLGGQLVAKVAGRPEEDKLIVAQNRIRYFSVKYNFPDY